MKDSKGMKGRLPSSLGDICGKPGGRGTILWEHSNLCERTLGSAGRSNQASCAKPCLLTLHEEFLNDPKIQIEFLLGWVRHIHMRCILDVTPQWGLFSRMNVPEAVFVSPLPGGAMDTKFLMGPYWTQDLGVSLARRRHLWGTFIPPLPRGGRLRFGLFSWHL